MSDASRLTVPVGPDDHIQGQPEAQLTLVEYGDLECPHCGRAHGILQEVQQALGDDLRFVFRHFPLAQIHSHALGAAQAAEAAGRQGKFWEMHDILFETQDALEPEDLLEYAAEIGLDLEAFSADMEDAELAQRVRRDFMSGVRSGVNGTPTFFINDIRHDGSWDRDALLAALLAAKDELHGARWRGR